MTTLEQRLAPSIETLAKAAAHDPTKFGPYCEFLVTANEAARYASDEQRKLMREFAATLPTPEEATVGIRKIHGMGRLMPCWWSSRGYARCGRKITWSVRRGGCRFPLGHRGACKPGSGRA